MKDLIRKFTHNMGAETVIKRVRGTSVAPSGDIVEKDHFTTSIFISSSIGCPFHCSFCQLTETGPSFFKLSADAIFNNVMEAIKGFPNFNSAGPIKICWMGMGDPSANVAKTLEVTTRLIKEIEVKEVDISTVNLNSKLVDAYNWLGNRVKVRLFYSLHTSNQWYRNQIIPNTESIEVALKSLDNFKGEKKIHYIPLKDCNDTAVEAMELISLLERFLFFKEVQVRLLEYNASDKSKFQRGNLELFRDVLQRANIDVKWQVSKGKEENAACGQFT